MVISNDPSMAALKILSSNLESLFLGSSQFPSTDAEIIVDSNPIPIHRCILAARSPFFDAHFALKGTTIVSYNISDLIPDGACVGREAFMLVLEYIYTGKLKMYPPEASQCVDDDCDHEACSTAVEFQVELLDAAAAFQIPELVSLFQRRLLSLVDKAFVEDIIPILLVAFRSKLDQLRSHCIRRVVSSNLDDITFIKELPTEVAYEIRVARLNAKISDLELATQDHMDDKHLVKIRKALDYDDVDLANGLLRDSNLTFDDAYALHYATAYCDPRVVAQLLELSSVNVNLKNERGYTPLHLAAMRRELAIIISLLRKRACAFEPTKDSQNAVTICKRRTRAKDYHAKMENGQESNKNRLCIDVLEREMRRNLSSMEDSVESLSLDDDLSQKLLYLEDRVAIARLYFPTEAKLAMEISQARITPESYDLLKIGDLNETPLMRDKRVCSRIDALMKTVELGRRHFPNCSEVLDKLLDVDPLQDGTVDQQKNKRMRLHELEMDFQKAFTEDKAKSGLSRVSASASSSSTPKKIKQHRTARV